MRIRDLLDFGGLINAKVVAGKGGLDKTVESVSVLEVTEPTNGRWVLKNQISVTAFYAIKDDVEAQKNLIIEFDKSGGAGIVICHIDFWLKRIDESIISLCDNLNFPLIVVPSDVSYIDIIIPINDRLLKIHSEMYKYSLGLQSELIELIVRNRDIHDIAKHIFNISNRGTIILDINSKVLSSEGISDECINLIVHYCKNNLKEIHKKYQNSEVTIIDGYENSYLLQPIMVDNDFFGFMAMERVIKHPFNYKDPELIMKYTSIAIALISTKKQRIEKMQDIYFRDFLGDLLTWNFESDYMAINRARSVGWEIENKTLMILINLNSAYEINGANDYIGEYTKSVLMPIIQGIVKKDNPNNLVGFRSDNIIILLEDEGGVEDNYKRAKKIAEEFLKRNKDTQDITFSVGISNSFIRVSEIPNAYKEALEAMTIGRRWHGSGRVYTYLELGYIPIFKENTFSTKYEYIKEYFLKPLIEHDRQHNTELVETLRNMLYSDMSIMEVANKMFIHRNTLLARKKKIIELLDNNPFEMPYKINYLILFSSEEKQY